MCLFNPRDKRTVCSSTVSRTVVFPYSELPVVRAGSVYYFKTVRKSTVRAEKQKKRTAGGERRPPACAELSLSSIVGG